jgi:hypothetical protein
VELLGCGLYQVDRIEVTTSQAGNPYQKKKKEKKE